MDILNTVLNFIWTIIEIIRDVLFTIIGLVQTLYDILSSFFVFLPQDVSFLLLSVLLVVIGVYLYRFVR